MEMQLNQARKEYVAASESEIGQHLFNQGMKVKIQADD